MNALQEVASRHVAKGWKIASISDTTLVLTRKAGMSGVWVILGILGLLFAVIPGLLAFLVGYVSRGDEQLIFSAEEAVAWLNKPATSTQKYSSESGGDLIRLIVVIAIVVIVFAMLGSC